MVLKMEVYFMLLSLLTLTSLSSSQECKRDLLPNVDFPGSDIKFVYSPSVQHCQQLCTQFPLCLFFTFLRPDWTKDQRYFYCYLKYTASGQPTSQTLLLGVTSGYSLKPCSPDLQPCLARVYQNVDFPGADYRFMFTADYQECQRICSKDPFCQFFTFIQPVFTPKVIRPFPLHPVSHLKFFSRIHATPTAWSSRLPPPWEPQCSVTAVVLSGSRGGNSGSSRQNPASQTAFACACLCAMCTQWRPPQTSRRRNSIRATAGRPRTRAVPPPSPRRFGLDASPTRHAHTRLCINKALWKAHAKRVKGWPASAPAPTNKGPAVGHTHFLDHRHGILEWIKAFCKLHTSRSHPLVTIWNEARHNSNKKRPNSHPSTLPPTHVGFALLLSSRRGFVIFPHMPHKCSL